MNVEDQAQGGRALIRRAADLLARFRFEPWAYGDSIGFEALIAASDLLADDRWASFARGFFRAWAAHASAFHELDNTAPGHAMCLCYERTNDDAILDKAARLADFLTARRRVSVNAIFASFERVPLRPPYGPASLPPDEAALLRDAGAGVFVDCLHFDPSFFVHLGRVTGEHAYIDLGVEQALGYGHLLQDATTGLFSHFWLERTGRAYNLGWSRGQGWALLGLLNVLALLPMDDLRREMIARRVYRLATGLARYQRPDGHWWAVAQDPASGDESSTAAFIATGFWRGIALNVLDTDPFAMHAEKAWRAAWERVDRNGMLGGVSAAVGASTAATHYHHVPTGFLVPWGQGPLILAACSREQQAE